MKNYLDLFSLKGKTAFIVGGVGLIGSEVTKALAQAGADATILDVNSEGGKKLADELTAAGLSSNFMFFDCTDLENIEENLKSIIRNKSTIDILVNCSYPRTSDWATHSFDSINFRSFRENIDIHMNSYAWIAKCFADHMIKKCSGGSIVQFGSTYGALGQDLTVYNGTDMKENMTYSAIKGGIINLTRQMASYYGQYNIRVNSLCPGGIIGPVAENSSQQPQQFIDNYSNKNPLKRLGNPQEIAAATLFLASDASSYITGTTSIVDGGWSVI